MEAANDTEYKYDKYECKLPWCVHNGATTSVHDCPYTRKFNITCSMPHVDQPNGKFAKAAGAAGWATE